MSLLIRRIREVQTERLLNCFGGQKLVPSAPGEKASVHHPNHLSHYTHCLACLPAVGIKMTAALWKQQLSLWKRPGLKETGCINIKMMF